MTTNSTQNDTMYREAYNKGEEVLPDYVYDAAFGSDETDLDDSTGAGELVEHLHPMLSLPTHFIDFDNLSMSKLTELGWRGDSLDGTGTVGTISWKVDGVAVSIIYDAIHDKIVRLVSRGKRFAGYVMNQAWHSVVPKVQSNLALAYATYDFRGELFITKSDFERINATLDKPYASPRAMIAGNMNAIEPNMDIVAASKILLHGIWSDDMPGIHCKQLLQIFNEHDVVPFFDVHADDDIVAYAKQVYADAMVNDIPCDGIVLQVATTDEHNGRANLDRIALKQHDESKYSGETVVDHIEWRLKNNGSYFPRMWFKPVMINGSQVTHTAGYCYDFITRQMPMSVGAKVLITMHGGVIPYVTKVLEPGNGDYQLPADIAPIQDGDMHIWSTASTQAVERLKFIRGMEMLDLDQCGTQLFSDMYEAGYHTLFDIAKDVQENKLTARLTFRCIIANTEAGRYKATQIVNRFKTFNHVWLLLALRCDGIGFKAANAIGQHLSGYELRDKRPLAGKFAQQVLANTELLNLVKKYSQPVLPEHADLAVGQAVPVAPVSNKPKACMSKKPTNGMKKAEFAATYLQDYDITDNIKEAVLLVCPAGENSNKIKFAQANGIAIKYYSDFIG